MKRPFVFLCGLCLILFLASCAPPFYIPNSANIPLPSDTTELNLGGGWSTAGGYVQASYNPLHHLIVTGNYSGMQKLDSGSFGSENYFGSAGAGFCTTFDSGRGRFEILSDFGLGRLTTNKFQTKFLDRNHIMHYYINNEYKKLSMQVDIGSSAKNSMIGLSARVSYVSTLNPVYGFQEAYLSNLKVISDSALSINHNMFFFEPTLFYAFGTQNIKIRTSIGLSYKIDHSDSWDQHQLSQNVYFSTGILVNLFQDFNF